jgi:hypothetical protein
MSKPQTGALPRPDMPRAVGADNTIRLSSSFSLLRPFEFELSAAPDLREA